MKNFSDMEDSEKERLKNLLLKGDILFNMTMAKIAEDVDNGHPIRLSMEYQKVPTKLGVNVPSDAVAVAMGIRMDGSKASAACLIKNFLDNHPEINQLFVAMQKSKPNRVESVDKKDYDLFDNPSNGPSNNLFNDDDDTSSFDFNDFINK